MLLLRIGSTDLGLPLNHEFDLAFVLEGADAVEFAGW